jgi:hypothetical protein
MSRFRVITGFGLAIALCGLQTGCGGGDNDDDNGAPRDAGARDAGARDAGATDAGATDAGATDAGGRDAGDGKYELTGEVGPVEGTAVAAECTATSDAREEGGCYAHYCGTNSASLAAAHTGSTCGSTAEIWLICDGLGIREAARCARTHALDADPREGTRTCMRQNAELDPLSDACLDCFLDSAACARENCVAECLTGDTPQCDACREEKGCTPGFYECAGLPNPQ